MVEAGTWKVVCATSVAGGAEAFARLGRVELVPEAEINASVIRGAQALITRSKVRVNEALLEGSSLQFYGTATAGTDHVDIAALERRGITWSEAAGSNANSVAEYVLCALAHLGLSRGLVWRGRTLGVVGAGHVGSRLAELAPALGLRVLLNDPPLRDRTGLPHYRPLTEVLAESDIVSLHVPLTDDGPYPTRGMADSVFFASMKPGAVFINASRGEVVVEQALRLASAHGAFAALVLDVFDHEPDIDLAILNIADLASPHIAGYSLDGRLKGTELVYRAACLRLGIDPVWQPPAAVRLTTLAPPAGVVGDILVQHCLLLAYHPLRDDERLRALPIGQPMRTHFQGLRQSYPERREFPHFRVDAGRCDPVATASLRRLGFAVA
jgi:erythronate-4-phosphate dehydrogenase